MGRFITVRRLGALGLALAGLAAISAGILTGRTAYLVFGMVAWWLLVFGGVAALLQRASMLMRMVAATRADLEMLASWQQRHPDELWRQLTRIGRDQRRAVAEAQEETLRLRKETKRSISAIERSLATLAEDQAGAATVQAANQLSIVSALVEAMSNQRKGDVELALVKAAVEEIPQQLQQVQADVQQVKVEAELRQEKALQAQAETAQETRRSLMEHSSLAMRVYRDIHSELDARQGTLDEAVGQLGRQASSIDELKSALVGIDDRLQEAGRSIESTSKGLEATNSSLDLAGKGVEAMSRGLEAASTSLDATSASLAELRADYEADKRKLKVLSRDEKQLRSISKKGLQWLKYETVREVEAILQLRQMLRVESPTPLLGGWAMDPESVYGLVQLLSERQPRLVVELGSGSSTVWVALTLRRIGAGRIISYDHLPEYAARTRAALRDAGLEEWAEVRDAPLADVSVGDETYPWYTLGDTASEAPIDILMVDGPPASTGPLARYPALPLLSAAMGEGGIVIVDDATRADEEEMLERWSREFPRLKPISNLGPRTVVLALEPASETAIASGP